MMKREIYDRLRRHARKGMRSTGLGILVNLALAFMKCLAAILGHSVALLADGIDSGVDVCSGLAVYFGLKIAVKPPDDRHPYGYGKAEPIAASVVGLILLLGAVLIILRSVFEILHPHRSPAPYTLVVLAGALLVKELLFQHVASVGDSIGSVAVKADAWHHRSDAIISAFAFVGISISLLGGTAWRSADAWAAIGAAFIILRNAWKQTRPAILELGDAAPDPSMNARVKQIAANVPGVIGLDKCLVRKMGFSFYVDLHIVVNGELSVREGHRIAHRVKDEIRKRLSHVVEVLVHVEPEEELSKKKRYA